MSDDVDRFLEEHAVLAGIYPDANISRLVRLCRKYREALKIYEFVPMGQPTSVYGDTDLSFYARNALQYNGLEERKAEGEK